MLGAVDYSRVPKGETILEAGAEEDFWWFRFRDTSIFRSMAPTWRKWVRRSWRRGDALSNTRNASALAHEDCEILRLERNDYERIAALEPKFRERLEEFYSKRVRGNALNGSVYFELLDDYRQYSLIDEFELLGLEQGVELARPK